MTDQTVNIPLLRKAVEWAEAEAAKPPQLCEWEQEYVRSTRDVLPEVFEGKSEQCGTCYCIAGYVTALVAPEFNWDEESACATANGALGLPDSHHLFVYNNTISDVRRIAEELAGERL